MMATPSERHMLHRELLHAIERDQLELLYQPVYDVPSGSIVSVEALVRWKHPTRGASAARSIPAPRRTRGVDAAPGKGSAGLGAAPSAVLA